MTAQQMVEHLAWVFEISIGEASVECSVPEETARAMEGLPVRRHADAA